MHTAMQAGQQITRLTVLTRPTHCPCGHSGYRVNVYQNIFSKHDRHVLFISFFSKMYNKKTFTYHLKASKGQDGTGCEWSSIVGWYLCEEELRLGRDILIRAEYVEQVLNVEDVRAWNTNEERNSQMPVLRQLNKKQINRGRNEGN